MRALLATCLSLGLAATVVGHAREADAARKYKKGYSAAYDGSGAHRYRQNRRNADPNATPDWYPHVLNQLPFGSKRWWEQMERERGGGTRP